MADGYYLTPEDYRTLKAMMDQFRKSGSLVNRQSRGVYMDPDDAIQAPEVYIAKVTSPGIPGLEEVGTAAAEPGSASCDIYQIVGGELVLTELDKTIYNLNQAPVHHDWIPVVRDKWGSWLVSIGEFRALGKCASDITQGSSDTFTLYSMYETKGSESAVSPAVTVSAYVRWGDYEANAWARLEWWPNGWEALMTTCPAGTGG